MILHSSCNFLSENENLREERKMKREERREQKNTAFILKYSLNGILCAAPT
jgi:hypothetical protein